MTADEEIARGREAASLINNAIYQESFILLKAQMMKAFQDTRYDQSEERDEIWREMKVLGAVERQIKAVMQTGKFAEKSIVNNVDNHNG